MERTNGHASAESQLRSQMVIRHINELIQLVEGNIAKEKERHESAMAQLEAMLIDLQSTVKSGSKQDEASGKLGGVFPGMKTADALIAYLNNAGPVPVARIVADLRRSGLKLGANPKRYAHNLKIVVASNSRKFKYNERNDTIELVTR